MLITWLKFVDFQGETFKCGISRRVIWFFDRSYPIHLLYIVSGLPSMRDSLTNPVHVYEGDDALITCVVKDIGENSVMWKKEDRERHSTRVLTAGNTRVTADKRFAVLHDSGTCWRRTFLKYLLMTFLRNSLLAQTFGYRKMNFQCHVLYTHSPLESPHKRNSHRFVLVASTRTQFCTRTNTTHM